MVKFRGKSKKELRPTANGQVEHDRTTSCKNCHVSRRLPDVNKSSGKGPKQSGEAIDLNPERAEICLTTRACRADFRVHRPYPPANPQRAHGEDSTVASVTELRRRCEVWSQAVDALAATVACHGAGTIASTACCTTEH